MTLLIDIGENRQPEKGILPSGSEPMLPSDSLLQDDLDAGNGCQKT